MMDTAKLFKTGRSQAVRLPKKYRFEGEAVRIRKHGNGVILEPIAKNDWTWLRDLEPLNDDAVAAALEDLPQQERPGLDTMFD